jgi:hypothetical protein
VRTAVLSVLGFLWLVVGSALVFWGVVLFSGDKAAVGRIVPGWMKRR